MIEATATTGLATQYERYFSKLAGASKVTVKPKSDTLNDMAPATWIVTFEFKPNDETDGFLRIEKICRALGESEKNAKVMQSLKNLHEYFKS